MKNCFAVLVIILGNFLMISCKEESKLKVKQESQFSFLNTDPLVESKKEKPATYPLIFTSGENNIAGRILIALGSKANPTVVFLHGNPGFEKNEGTGQILRRGGYNSVFFSYSGTWGNKGVFSYRKSIKDVKMLVEYLIENRKQLRVDTENIYLCGFSMGADIALLASEELKSIKGVISIDPWNAYHELKRKSEKELNQYIRNLEKRPCLNIASGKEFVTGILNDRTMNLKQTINNSIHSKLYIFSKKKGKRQFENYCGQKNNERIIVLNAADHSFSDKRIALAKTIFNWLEKN